MEIKDFATTLRAEVTPLFGIRWDSFVEWVVIAWLSAWFWTVGFNGGFDRPGPFEERATDHHFVGPLSGIGSFLQSAGVDPPGWSTDFVVWLHAQNHSWVYWVALCGAVLTCVTSARSYKHTGLRVLALVSAAIACEVHGSLWPVLWVTLIAGVPALAACSIDWIDRLQKKSKFDKHQYYFAEGILIKFLTGIVFLFLKVPFAPVVVLGQLVRSFRTEIPWYPAEDITREVARTLETASAEGAVGVDELTRAASAAVCSLAGNQSPEARKVLEHYSHLLRKRQELQDAEKRRTQEESRRLLEFRYRNQRAQLRDAQENEASWRVRGGVAQPPRVPRS